ncbi:hypothetical protein [Streptomyces sp. NPDC006270]|uniref:hypothetical protein n=1 Tax=Streptomyces sp. NPDC006270 TaxID=3364741 RepID=UPI003676E4A8
MSRAATSGVGPGPAQPSTGPPVAGVVAEAWSWRTVFYGLAVLTALPAIALVVVLRRAPANDRDAGGAATGPTPCPTASRPPRHAPPGHRW